MIKLNEEDSKEMNSYLDDTTIEEILVRNHKLFRFQMMLKPEHLEQSIENLDFSVRSYNCLKRAGLNTIGDLVDFCYAKDEETSKKQLRHIRNCGTNSADEILIKLFYYQFSILPDYRRKTYMKKIQEING